MKEMVVGKLPFILAILLYLLIYLIRLQQGGWEIESNLFLSFRQDLDKKITQVLPSPQAQLLSGILLGIKSDLPANLRLALRDTSTLHIVVVSGQNLSLVAGLFLPLAWVLSRKVAILLSFSAIIFYTLLTGAQVPVLRAAIMAALSFLAILIGKERDGAWTLFLTAGFMLLINPKWLTDLSFQLSFLATYGVVVVAPIIVKKLQFLPSFISQDLAITFSAQLMVTPVIAQNFHQASVVSLITNLLVGWSVPFIMILGSIFLILSFISSGLAYFVAILVNALLTYFIYVVSFFASLPFAWEYIGEQSAVVWIGYYLIVSAILIVL
ncbi:MAG: ComEC/Rec2 family competence protein [Candidatus Daviesbacteria bacterium]|nr:ComEC/Rec2 family competence protein [Candidatus Daviesbacteria bacterium]